MQTIHIWAQGKSPICVQVPVRKWYLSHNMHMGKLQSGTNIICMLLDQSSVASTHRFLYYSYIEPTYRLHRIALSITQLVFSQSPQYIYLRKAYEKGKLLYAGCVQLWINPWAGEVPEISASLVQNRRRTTVEKRRKVSLKSRGTTLRHHVRSKFN